MHKRVVKYWLLLPFVILGFFLLLPYDRMTEASVYVLIVSGLLLSTGYYLTRDFASPQVLLCGTWSISLFLTSLEVTYSDHIEQFNEMLRLDTWLMMLAAILSFFIAATLTMYPLRTKYREGIGQQKLNWHPQLLRWTIFAAFSVAFAIYAYAVVRTGGVPAFSEDVNVVRAAFIPATLGVFLVLFQLVVPLTTAKIVIYGVKDSRFEILLSVIALVCSFLTTQRIAAIEMFLMSFVIFAVLWPYTPRHIRWQRRKIFSVYGPLLMAGFVWAFVYIGQTRGLDAMPLTDIKDRVLEQFFIYFGGPAPRNLQMTMEGGIYHGINEAKYGALFFRPILWFTQYRGMVDIVDTFKGPNNATSFFQYYLDFGVAGVILISMFWGAVCGYVYGRLRRTLRLLNCVLYSILAGAIYFFPLSERFSEPSTFIKIVIFSLLISSVMYLHTLITRSRLRRAQRLSSRGQN